jgi:NDP-sugar pyrophosphorylase family protein
MFRPEDFFDLKHFTFADIFDDVEYVWESIRRIVAFISQRAGVSRAIGLGTLIHEAAILDGGPIEFGRDCIVEGGAYIRGPALFGNRVTVRHGAYVRGNLLAGDDCVIGHATEIKDTILLDGAKAPHFAYVGNSILGNRVNLGAGTKLSNLKIIPSNILVRALGKVVDTGLHKLGSIVGDDTEIGCNCVLNPGLLIGPRSVVYPNTNISGYVPADSIVKLRQQLERETRRSRGHKHEQKSGD